ncbi:trypsin-like serine protease [Sorangium sp. So ce1335]|uniref:trypsin-like serine protease n=1 Tax=Sorangium sp. So ce1335 TaxID=3133335 RepID=UPI003F5FA963
MTNNENTKGCRGLGGLGLAWIRTGAASAMLALATAACGAADPSDDVSDEPLGTGTEEIRSGTPGGGIGAVEVVSTTGPLQWSCTGTLVGDHMILTAAHCFDDVLGSALSGTVSAKLSYAVTGTTWKCLTGSPSTGKCTTFRNVYVRRLQQGGEVGADMAVVFTSVSGGSFSNVEDGDPADGIYTGHLSESEPYAFYGRGPSNFEGTDDGTMRFMHNALDYVDASHFVTDADAVRTCRGDSGGPYFFRDGAVHSRWMFGIHSNSEYAIGGACAEVGGKSRGMRLTVNRINNINNFRSLRGLAPCTQFSSSFPDWWVCS